jgi:hypothetical protein
MDVGNARYTLIDSAGAVVASYPRRAASVLYPWLGRAGSESGLYDPTVRATEAGAEYVVFRIDAAGTIIDSLPPLALPQAGEEAPVPAPIWLLTPRLTFRPAPNGDVWFGITDRYRLHRRGPEGDTLLIVEREVEPAEVSEAEVDSLLAQVASSPFPVPRSAVPRHKPYFQRLIVEDDGHLWVHRVEEGNPPGTRFDVFDPKGRFLGELRSPVALAWIPSAEIHGDFMVGVTTDALGVERAVRLRIERRAAGL